MSPQVLIPAHARVLAPAPTVARRAAAASLHAASRALARLARRLTVSAAARPAPSSLLPQFEFHAPSGAPEGALYANGVLVAILPGVNRL
jgi:hypothetical protein